jgi:ABC-2 type transport system ATP-binding protein
MFSTLVNTAIEVKNLKKSYGSLVAVNDVSFEVNIGEIFGLLGPNGAGKTTILEILEGLRKPDYGKINLLGINPFYNSRQLKKIIGVQLQTSGLPPSMTVGEAINFFCAYHKVSLRYDLIQRLGLKEKINTQYEMLSTGQQRRLALILAIAHNPSIIFLDEPTSGLDVDSRVEMHNLMNEIKAGGTTIILATHDMAEAEKMADRVAILLHGQVVVIGTPKEITATGAGYTKISVYTENQSLIKSKQYFPHVLKFITKEDYLIYFTTDPGSTVSKIISSIESNGDNLIDLRVERPSLEERFMEITKKGTI